MTKNLLTFNLIPEFTPILHSVFNQ